VNSHPSAPYGAALSSLRPTWDSAGSVDVPAWPCTWWGLPGRRVATTPVRSYRTFSTLPATGWGSLRSRPRPAAWATCRVGGVFLWHFPAGFPGSGFPTTMPFGVRTFLERVFSPARGCPASALMVAGPWLPPGTALSHSYASVAPQPRHLAAAPSPAMRDWHTGHSACAPAACRPSHTRSSFCSSVSLPPSGAPANRVLAVSSVGRVRRATASLRPRQARSSGFRALGSTTAGVTRPSSRLPQPCRAPLPHR